MPISLCSSITNEHGRELTEHGSALFPIASYDDDILTNPVPWHWHDELEAGIIIEGTAIVAAGSEKYKLSAGEGFFINSGIFHATWGIDTSACTLHSIVFHPNLVGSTVDSIFWQKYLQPILSNTTLTILPLFQDETWMKDTLDTIKTTWRLCSEETPGYEFEIRTALSKLIFILNSNCLSFISTASPKKIREEARIKEMLKYIHLHFEEELSTSEIAQSASISNSECLRCFHNVIGITPIQYLKQYRIQKAAEFLHTTNIKIADIAAKCGFREMSYFSKTFRSLKGVTPTQFRDQTNQRN